MEHKRSPIHSISISWLPTPGGEEAAERDLKTGSVYKLAPERRLKETIGQY